MIYFAYGSNLDRAQMGQRCPNAKLVGPARLPDHRLCFPRRSPVRGCAVASVEPYEGGVVWGVLWELDANDLDYLDAREGYDPINPTAVNRYRRVVITVDQADGEPVEALTYIAVPEADPGLPSSDYMRHIVEGAASHDFPANYVAMLRAVPVMEVA